MMTIGSIGRFFVLGKKNLPAHPSVHGNDIVQERALGRVRISIFLVGSPSLRLRATRHTPGGSFEAQAASSTISKSAFATPQSGHDQSDGTSSQRVPARMPCSGSPAASS